MRSLLIYLVIVLCFVYFSTSTLINPSIQSVYLFSPLLGETKYSFFVNHPPIISDNEEHVLILTQEEDERNIFFSMFPKNVSAGPISTWNFVASIPPASRCHGEAIKIQVHALPFDNFLVNQLFLDPADNYSVSCVWNVHWNKLNNHWNLFSIFREQHLSSDFPSISHVRLVPSDHVPSSLIPKNGTAYLNDCQDILWWTASVSKEFSLCPKSNPDGSRDYIPVKNCYQYLEPSNGIGRILSYARLDKTALIGVVDEGNQYILYRLNTTQCPKFSSNLTNLQSPFSTQSDHSCQPCTLVESGRFGHLVNFTAGIEPPSLLVPDSGKRIVSYYCYNTTTEVAESLPSWTHRSAPTSEVSLCSFTLYDVHTSSSDKYMFPIPSPIAPNPPQSHHSTSSKTKNQQAEDDGRKQEDDRNFISEILVPDPISIWLTANRTVRLSHNGDLLYATHFTSDGISVISVLDISSGGAFEQGSLPLMINSEWAFNSFSDDADTANQYLYAIGFLSNIIYDYTIPIVVKYDVSPLGTPTLLSQLYIQSKTGTIPTSNYMLPIPNFTGASVIVTPKEVIINQVNASSLSLDGKILRHQYTSSNVLDVNVIRPVLSSDGSRLIIFCQEFGMGKIKSSLTAYVMQIDLTDTEPARPPESTPSHHPTPPPTIHHLSKTSKFMEDVKRKVSKEFPDSKIDLTHLNSQMNNPPPKAHLDPHTPSHNADPPHTEEPLHTPIYNVSLSVNCRFSISLSMDSPDVPIGAAFFANNSKLLISYTSALGSLNDEDSIISIYDLKGCHGYTTDPNTAINTSIELPVLTSITADINWNSKPFAENGRLSNCDEAGVRLWDIPFYEYPDQSVVFFMANQSLHAGLLGSQRPKPSIGAPANESIDLSSAFVEFFYNHSAQTITLIGESEALPCSPISSQVIPNGSLQPDEVGDGAMTLVWVLCQFLAPEHPSQIMYSLLSINITAPEVEITPSTPEAETTGFTNQYNYVSFSQIPNNMVENISGWSMEISANVTFWREEWEVGEIVNFYVSWDDRRIYFGNGRSLHITAISAQGRPIAFGQSIFNNAQQINSMMAWPQIPGFGFLGDVQWVWVISECPSGTKLTNSGYCSKCAPGTFGLGCSLCTAGFVCDQFGLIVPDGICPEGHFCVAGSSNTGIGILPFVCPAGSYCPGGVATNNTLLANSIRACSAGYYCPEGSKVATARACPEKSWSESGAKSIHDCTCIDGYFGQAGKCRPCLYLGDCALDEETGISYMSYPTGYYPSDLNSPNGVTTLVPCSLNEEACNEGHEDQHGVVSTTRCYYVCEDTPANHSKTRSSENHPSNCKITCPDPDHSLICAEGYTDRLCSRCSTVQMDHASENYYQRGHLCIPCSSSKNSRSTIWIVVACVIIGFLLLLVVIGQTFIALILELLSMVVLNSIGLVPVWLLDVLLIFVLVYFINRGKRYNSLIKLQEQRSAKRKLKRRAKRMAAKRREMSKTSKASISKRSLQPKSTQSLLSDSDINLPYSINGDTNALNGNIEESEQRLDSSTDTGTDYDAQLDYNADDLPYEDKDYETLDSLTDNESEGDQEDDEDDAPKIQDEDGIIYQTAPRTHYEQALRILDPPASLKYPGSTINDQRTTMHSLKPVQEMSLIGYEPVNTGTTHNSTYNGHTEHDTDHSHSHEHDEEHEHEQEYISEGLIKSFLFYLQTSEALTEGLFNWTELLLNLQNISPFHQIAILDCLWPSIFTYKGKFIMYMVLIPLLTAAMVLLYLAGLAKIQWTRYKKIRQYEADSKLRQAQMFLQFAWSDHGDYASLRAGSSKEELAKLDSKKRRLRYRWTRIWLFFVSVFYFELTEGILKVFRCDPDPASEIKYMESEPWIRCAVSADPYNVVFPLAIAGLLVYVVGIPILFFYLLYRHRNRLHNPKVMSWLGMLYEEYQPHLWWFELTMIARRVFIAIVLSMLPEGSVAIPVLIMAILMAAMGTNLWFRAFVSDAENTIDLMAMCVMLITYISGIVQRLNQEEAKLRKLTLGALPGQNATAISTHSVMSLFNTEPNAHSPPNSEHHSSHGSDAITWASLPKLEIFLFVLNTCMFFGYMGMLLSPRIKQLYQSIRKRYSNWKQHKEEEKNMHLSATEAAILDN